MPLPIWPAPMMPTVLIGAYSRTSLLLTNGLPRNIGVVTWTIVKLWILCRLFPAVERRFKFGQNLEKVSNEPIIRDLENRSFLILVDSDNHS